MQYALLLYCNTVLACLYVTYDGNDTAQQLSSTSSTSTVNCSPRWKVYPRSRTAGGTKLTRATTQQKCLEACVKFSSCVAVDWSDDSGKCRRHVTRIRRSNHTTVTQFELVRQCDSASGTWRKWVFFCMELFHL